MRVRFLILVLLACLGRVSGAATGPITVALSTGWNPVAFQCPEVNSLSANPLVAGVATYNATGYQLANFDLTGINAEQGGRRGFWVFANAPTSFSYSGDQDANGNLVELVAGWNLVSFATTSPVPGSALTATQDDEPVSLNSVVLTTFYQVQSAQNVPVDVLAGGILQPGRPYWVFATGPVVLRFTVGPLPSPTPQGSPVASPGGSPPVQASPGGSQGLSALNQVRALGNLPSVPEGGTLSLGCQAHAQYQLLNNVLSHSEEEGAVGYSPEGDLSAEVSGVSGNDNPVGIQAVVFNTVTAPFHGVGLLDPLLRAVGLGHASDNTLPAGQLRSSTVIDTRSLRFSTLPGGVTLPLTWPRPGATINVTSYEGLEIPDPLAGLDWGAPSGCPLYVFVADTPNVSSATLVRQGVGEVVVAHFDQNTYVNPDPAEQAAGRQELAFRRCIIMLPQEPLVPGAQYTATLVHNGSPISWTFFVASTTTTLSGQRYE